MLRVQTYTFGCKVNKADTATMENLLSRSKGVHVVGEKSDPDVVVVNTCTVTHAADRQARQLLRRIHRDHPNARIVVTGCYAEAEPHKLQEMGGVLTVLPIRQQNRIPEILGLDPQNEIPSIEDFSDRTRAILKLQEGCNAYCSFCILPFIRGKSRSIPIAELERQAQRFETNGYREIVITGTHVGAYGRDLSPRIRFSQALASIAKAAANTALRISSLEPTTLTSDFIRLMRENPQFRPHFHIPLQSGSTSVLKRMNRKYTPRIFADRITQLSKVRSNVGVGTDVIVGFPKETDAEFQETYDLLVSLPIQFLHVFRFSPRLGTKAAESKDDVSARVKFDRMKALVALGEKKKREFYDSFMGSVQPVVIEKKRDGTNRLTGYTPHYVKVRTEGPDRLMGREVDVRLIHRDEEAAIGQVA